MSKIILTIVVILLLFALVYWFGADISEGFRRGRRGWGRGRGGWGRGRGGWGRRGWRGGWRGGWGGGYGWWPWTYPYYGPSVTTVYTGASVPDDYSIYKNQQPSEYVSGLYKKNKVRLGDALRMCNQSSKCQAMVYDDNTDTAYLIYYGNPMELTDVDSAGIDTYIKN